MFLAEIYFICYTESNWNIFKNCSLKRMWPRPILRFSYCQIDCERFDIEPSKFVFRNLRKQININHLHIDAVLFSGNCLKYETEICIFWVDISVSFVCLSRLVCKEGLGRFPVFPLLGKGKAVPLGGLKWPRGFQEVKVPRFHDNGTGWW